MLGNFDLQSSSSAVSTVEPLKPDDKKLCHQILYDFLHGKTSNPVDAGTAHIRVHNFYVH